MSQTRIVIIPPAASMPAPFLTFDAGGRVLQRGSLLLEDSAATLDVRTVAVAPGADTQGCVGGDASDVTLGSAAGENSVAVSSDFVSVRVAQKDEVVPVVVQRAANVELRVIAGGVADLDKQRLERLDGAVG